MSLISTGSFISPFFWLHINQSSTAPHIWYRLRRSFFFAALSPPFFFSPWHLNPERVQLRNQWSRRLSTPSSEKKSLYFFFAALMLPFFSGFDAGEVKIFNGLPPPPPTFVLCPVFVVSQIPFPLSLPWMIIRRTPRGVPWKKKKRKKLYKKKSCCVLLFLLLFSFSIWHKTWIFWSKMRSEKWLLSSIPYQTSITPNSWHFLVWLSYYSLSLFTCFDCHTRHLCFCLLFLLEWQLRA